MKLITQAKRVGLRGGSVQGRVTTGLRQPIAVCVSQPPSQHPTYDILDHVGTGARRERQQQRHDFWRHAARQLVADRQRLAGACG